MIGLSDVRDWLKTFGVGQSFSIGKIDNKKEKSIGVYQRKGGSTPRMALGGLAQTGYDIKSVSVLIHWNKNAKETEEAAGELFEKLRNARDIAIGGVSIFMLSLEVAEPQDVGTDDGGVYEQVIWFDLYVERQETAYGKNRGLSRI